MHNVVSKLMVLGLPIHLGNASNLETLPLTPQLPPRLRTMTLALQVAMTTSRLVTIAATHHLILVVHRLLLQATAPPLVHQVVGTVLRLLL